MSEPKSLAQNTLWLTAASVGQKVIAFGYFTVLANTLGTHDNGAYFLALGLITTVAAVGDFGLTSVLTRGIAKNKEQATSWVRSVLGQKMWTIPLAILLAVSLPSIIGYSAEVAMLVRVAIAIMVADSLSLTLYGVLRGLHNLAYESLGIFIGQILSTVAGITLILADQVTLPNLILALTLGSLWNVLFAAYRVVRRLGLGALLPTWEREHVLLRPAIAFFLSAAFVKVYSYFDSFLLNAMLGTAAVGVYSVAYKLTYAFQFLPLSFIGALYPSMSAAADDPERLKKIFYDAEWYLALLCAPIVFGIFALAPDILQIFKPEYASALLPLSVLIFTLLFIFLDFPIGCLLNATHRQNEKTAIMGVVMVVNIAANYLLIPRLGIVGASVAAVISFVVMFVVGWWRVERIVDLRFDRFLEAVGGFIAAGAIMAIAVFFTRDVMPFYASILLGAVTYGALIFAFRAFTLEHLRSFRGLLRKDV